MMRGDINGADPRLSEATLTAFDQWFSAQVEPVRRTTTAAASDDSDRGSSPDGRREVPDGDPDRWRGSSTAADVDGARSSDDGGDRHDCAMVDTPPRSSSPNFDPSFDLRPPPPLTKSTKSLPVLPNRNAVYVADAILPPETAEGSRDDRYQNGMDRKSSFDSDGDDELEVVLPSSSPSPEVEMDHASAAEVDASAQEEATDLSLPKQNGDRKLTYSNSSSNRNGDAVVSSDYLSGGSSGSEGSGSGSQSPMTQAPPPPHGLLPPPHNFMLNPSAAMAAARLFPPSATQSISPFYHQRALQLAAMSQAAALGLPFHGKDVAAATSKPEIRSAAHAYIPNVYGNSASVINTG